jgi:hypothetical protein
MAVFEEEDVAQILTSFPSNKTRDDMNNTIHKGGAI